MYKLDFDLDNLQQLEKPDLFNIVFHKKVPQLPIKYIYVK